MIAVWLMLMLHAALVGRSAMLQSPTLNEPGHLVAGLSHWDSGDFTLYRVNPPLVRVIAAVPVILRGYIADWSGYYEHIGARPVFEMGENFIAVNGRDSIHLFILARWACIPLSLIGAWICYLWARDLFGHASGLMACSLWCFSPMVLGHASMIAPDAHASSLGLAACYTFWKWLKQPTWAQAIITGGVLGLAELAKTTLILFYPLWPLIWLLYRLPIRHEMTRSRWTREAGMLALRMLVGLYVLNLGYLGGGSFTKLNEFQFVSEMLGGEGAQEAQGKNRFHDTWFGEIYVPLPSNYVIGIDVQQRDFEDFSRPSYLRGRYEAKGWWYYYAYAILVKAPLGTLGLIALSLVVAMVGQSPQIRKHDLLVLLSPAVVIFIAASIKSGFSHHSRYVLPCVPFMFIWVSQLAVHIRVLAFTAIGLISRRWTIARVTLQRRQSVAVGICTTFLLSWSIISSLAVYPHSIAYFNEAVGGPKSGPEHLLNSNIDWGQDLLFLERWILDQNDDYTPVFLAFDNYYSPFDLEIARIQPWPFEKDAPEPEAIADGYYAISVNQLYEFPWPVRGRERCRYFIDARPMAHLRKLEPAAWAGYSIRVFTAKQVRQAYEAPPSPPLWEGFGDAGSRQ